LLKAKTKINQIFGKKIPIRAGMGIFVYTQSLTTTRYLHDFVITIEDRFFVTLQYE